MVCLNSKRREQYTKEKTAKQPTMRCCRDLNVLRFGMTTELKLKRDREK